MRRSVLACCIVILFLLQTWSNVNFELSESSTSNSYREDILFNQSGFYEDGVYTTTDGEVHVNRPHIQWTYPNQGLAIIRSGACSVAIDSLDEVWIMGGRTDLTHNLMTKHRQTLLKRWIMQTNLGHRLAWGCLLTNSIVKQS